MKRKAPPSPSLRLTPIPQDPPTPAPKSLIVVLRIPKTKIPSGQPVSLHNLRLAAAAAGETNTSPTSSSSTTSNALTISSSSSWEGPSTANPPPEDPVYTSLEATRKTAARNMHTIFHTWAHAEVSRDLEEAIQERSMSPDTIELELIQRKVWVRKSLQLRYKVYIQTYTDDIVRLEMGEAQCGSKCEFPGCGERFVKGGYRVSFEPLEWTEPGAEQGGEEAEDEGEEDEDNSEDEDLMVDLASDTSLSSSITETESDTSIGSAAATAPTPTPTPIPPIPPIPDYANLPLDPDDPIGEFYHLACFEKLLGPSIPYQKHKRKRTNWQRPSPICRLYSLINAETRPSEDGRYLLGEDATELLERWREAMWKERMEEMVKGFKGFFKDVVDEEKAVKEEEEEGRFRVKVGGGRGLAECFAAMEAGVEEMHRGPGRPRKKMKASALA